MRIHFYVHVDELEYLNKILTEKIDMDACQISIAPTYFENSYLVDISYDVFMILKDNNVFTTLISL